MVVYANAQEPVRLASTHQLVIDEAYVNDSIQHITWKPVIYADTVLPHLDEPWFKKKFFHEHLVQVQQSNYNIYGDIIVDEYIGKSKRFVKTPMMNTRGFEISGNIGNKFYFETAFYENQGRFPGWVDSVIRKTGTIPRQARFKNVGDGKGFDFNYSTARLVFIPNKHLLFDLGYNNHFIGDGYRSFMLSDFSPNYPYLKAAVTFGKFQYSVMWSQYISETKSEVYALGYPRKWAQTFLIDWKATKNLTISLFETVVWPDEDSLHNKDISWTLASPIMFLHSNHSPNGVRNNEIVGLNAKYKVAPGAYIYGQWVVDHFGDKNSWKNRYAAQIGIRAVNLFNIPRWNGLAEFNTAKPYMYASENLSTVYGHSGLPLAHPLGANFKEGVVVTSYAYKNWQLRVEVLAARYGVDSANRTNYGHDIFRSIDTRTRSENVNTGQGIYTKLYYGDVKLAYLLNPQTNMRIEAGATYRKESNDRKEFEDWFFYIGIRLSFRNLIYDF